MQTRLYRVLLIATQLATVTTLLVDRFGPGIGLAAADIGIIDAVASSIIVIARQVGDPATPTLPTIGPVPPATVPK